jgi:hypothetical protein
MPLYDEPHLMISGPFRSGADLFQLELSPTEPDRPPQIRGRRVWHSGELSNDVASSVLWDGYVYGFDLRDIQSKLRRPSRGEFRCLDFRTGKVCWSSDRPGHSALIVVGGKLIMLNDRGEVLLVRATPKSYEELARVQTFPDEICWTSPALDRGRLYLRSPTRAACLYLGDPASLEPQRLAASRPAGHIPARRRWNAMWLVQGERDCPADPPDGSELLRWYAVSVLGVMGLAALLALAAGVALDGLSRRGLASEAARSRRLHVQRLGMRIVFWAALIVLGVAATPLGNRLQIRFVFTWPVALLAVQQLALAAVIWAHRHRGDRRADWLSAGAALALVGACLAYYDLCRRCDLAVLRLFLGV